MKDLWKKQYYNIILVTIYTALAAVVYILLFARTLPSEYWWVSLISGILIVIIGAVIGYFFIKANIKEEKEKEAKALEAEASNKEENTETEVANTDVVENNNESEEVKETNE